MLDQLKNYLIVVMIAISAILYSFTETLADSEKNWERLRKSASTIQSISADFTQEKQLSILKSPIISKGRFLYQAPAAIRWEYVEPIKSIMIISDREINAYSWSQDKFVKDLTEDLQVKRFVFEELSLWFSGRFNESSFFKASYDTADSGRIILVPQEDISNYISKIEVILTDKPGVISAIIIRENDSDFNHIKFQNILVNENIPKEMFEKP